jgi:hypothetical protein
MENNMRMYTTFHPNVLQELKEQPGCVVMYVGTVSFQLAKSLTVLDAALQSFHIHVSVVNVAGLGSVVAIVKDQALDTYFAAPHFEEQSVEEL